MKQAGRPRTERDGWTWIGIAVVALAAAVMSFDALRRLAERAGVTPVLGWLLPFAVDAAVLVATRAWLADSNPRVTRYARALALFALGLSVAGNAVEHAMTAYALPTPWWVVVAVSAIPPVMLGATAHLAALVVSRRSATPATDTAPPEVAPPVATATQDAPEPEAAPKRAPGTALVRQRPDTAAGGKAAAMRATFDRYLAEGRLDELTGAELARVADAAPSLGRRYLKEWREAANSEVAA